MRSFFRTLVAVLSFAVLATVIPAAAQDYPSRPVTIVVGYTPGATSDLVARTIGERLNAAWGQSVIVDNRSGVGGNIAAAYVARAQPDGYTLMVGTDAMMTTNVYLYKNAPFDPVKDFAPVIYAGANIICLAVNTELPANSVADVIAYAKANPGKLQYGSSGAGSPHHLAGELLRQKTGIDIVHVPYRGGGATINDLLGGHIKVAFLSLSTAVPHLTTGKIRILAVVEKNSLPGHARRPDDRRDRSRIRNIVLARHICTGRDACAFDCTAQCGDPKRADDRERKGEARRPRRRGGDQHAGTACRHRQDRAHGARRARQGRQYPAGMNTRRRSCCEP